MTISVISVGVCKDVTTRLTYNGWARGSWIVQCCTCLLYTVCTTFGLVIRSRIVTFPKD
jgi:hypothetical protein